MSCIYMWLLFSYIVNTKYSKNNTTCKKMQYMSLRKSKNITVEEGIRFTKFTCELAATTLIIK